MKEASAASGEMVSQATTAWDFSDPVVLLSAFTVIFAGGMVLWLWTAGLAKRWMKMPITMNNMLNKKNLNREEG